MPLQQLVVVGDAHLGAVPRSVEDALLRFLDEVPKLGDSLLLNGDLFGFWFSYRRAIPRAGIRVLARLAELARRLPVLMTGGNHDRWGESFWEPELGIRYSATDLRFTLAERPALALHGDGVAEPSRRAALKQRLFSHPLVSLGYRLLPAELGFRLAQGLNGTLDRSEAAVRLELRAATLQREWAERALRASPSLGLLVMGHTHRAASAELAPGQRYLNPGAWLDGNRYAIVRADAIELSQFQG